MADKRRERRQPLRHAGWIRATADEPLTECLLSDVSHKGARLIAKDIKSIADRFDLFLTGDGKVGRRCKVIWRTETEIGVTFQGRMSAKIDENATGGGLPEPESVAS